MKLPKTVAEAAGLTLVLVLVTTAFMPQPARALPPPIAAPVQVVNTPLPVSVQNPSATREPFQTILGPGVNYSVPSDRRMVIESVNAGCLIDSDIPASYVGIQTFVNGQGAGHEFRPHSQPGNASKGVHELTRIYADPGSTVSYFSGQSGAGTFICNLTISGYLEGV